MSNIIDSIQLSGVTYGIKGSGGTETIELTQAQYDALVDKDPNVFYIITDAQAGDLTNYYTKTETNSLLSDKADTATTYTKTEVDNAITAATSTKQDTLVSSQNIKTINNQSILGSGNIDIQGGGKAIEAGRGITITTGETADTVSFNLPISGGTGTNSIVEGDNTTASGMYGSHAEGYHTRATGWGAHAEGNNTTASGNYSHAEGNQTSATGNQSHSEGFGTRAINLAEHASGQYNVSSKASTTFGDSGNTLFSVGNGTSNSARHNAFEIRQNGDIYLSSGGTDIKLQDHLGGGGGGSITIDPSLDSGSTNAVANSAITTAIDSKQNVLNTGYYGGVSTSYLSSGEGTWEYASLKKFVNSGNTATQNGDDKVYFTRINGKKLVSAWNPNIIPLPNLSLVETSAITTSISSSSTDAQVPSAKAVYDQLGGLKLVKLSQSEYDSLATKDNSTLYVIVN